MKIGFISTWFERGAAYVTKSYIESLEKNHDIFVYARGGESYGKGDENWDLPYVTWGLDLLGTHINFSHFSKWIKKNNIELLFFNEQNEMDILFKIREKFPHIILGTYIDYYKENTVEDFKVFDFLICNTKRHYSVFFNHPQAFYVPWGTNVELFNPNQQIKNEKVSFFHSAGMSNRKGTKLLIEAFIEGELYKHSQLIIHTQKELSYLTDVEARKYNIEIINKTIGAPGLYHRGDIYVYPTTLEGLGLTLYEALASGLPIITTDSAPMNEVIDESVGRLIKVKEYRSRADAYYWPLSIADKESLIQALKFYCDKKESLDEMKKNARRVAVEKWNWDDRSETINNIFSSVRKTNVSKVKQANVKKLDRIRTWIGSSQLYSMLKKNNK